jgi:hypothetical protein
MIIYECSAKLNLFSSMLLCSILNFQFCLCDWGPYIVKMDVPGVLQGTVKTHQSDIQRTEVIILVLCFFGAKCGGC